jgi:hypothetical protein
MTTADRFRPASGRALKTLLAAVLGFGMLVGAGTSQAAPCAGFTDIDDSHPFCPSVEWLRNRAITLGCTSTSVFCPFASVSRLQMAAFMNRLGVALTPQMRYQEASGGALDLDTSGATPLCSTAAQPLAVNGFPRRAGVSAAFSGQAGASAANVDLRLVYSVNGGAWTVINAEPSSSGATSGWLNAVVHALDTPLAVGNSYAFGLAVSRSPTPATTGGLTAWNCQLEAAVYSRTGTGSPF